MALEGLPSAWTDNPSLEENFSTNAALFRHQQSYGEWTTFRRCYYHYSRESESVNQPIFIYGPPGLVANDPQLIVFLFSFIRAHLIVKYR